MKETPLVSIRCMVYNHEPFLRQCLDGFVMQKTTFPYEAIVHDDASTDGSAAIIREYADKYPDIIKPIYETENQYNKQDGSLRRILDEAIHPKAKYVAMCEGDDYWTDPNKLQLQVDYLEEHTDCSFSVHDFRVWDTQRNELRATRPIQFVKENECIKVFTMSDYKTGVYIAQTLSCVYRKVSLQKSNFYKYKTGFDMTLFFALLTQGNAVFFNRVMGVYRTHPSSITSSQNSRRFHDNIDCKLFSLCKVEKTQESRDFVYHYLEPLSLSQILCKRWNVIINYFRYLGLYRGIKLTIVYPIIMALKILRARWRD